MRVSVVIPVYNEEKYIESCLKSLTHQIVPPDEIIVVDNNSTDKTPEILKKFPVKVLHEHVQGIIPARNNGFDAASFDIIARCDADTVVPADWIAKIKENFESKKIDALSGTLSFYDMSFKSPAFTNIFLDFMRGIQKGKNTLIGPNMAMTKAIWLKIHNEVCTDPKKVHEDLDLGIHINKVGGEIGIDKTLIVEASGRRMVSNPRSFFIEYPTRLYRHLHSHGFI